VNGGSNIGWDLNGDGDYTDASGLTPVLTWSDLQALGLQAGQSYRITVRVTGGGLTDFDRASLMVRRI
jgi:hypothetical protein